MLISLMEWRKVVYATYISLLLINAKILTVHKPKQSTWNLGSIFTNVSDEITIRSNSLR